LRKNRDFFGHIFSKYLFNPRPSKTLFHPKTEIYIFFIVVKKLRWKLERENVIKIYTQKKCEKCKQNRGQFIIIMGGKYSKYICLSKNEENSKNLEIRRITKLKSYKQPVKKVLNYFWTFWRRSKCQFFV